MSNVDWQIITNPGRINITGPFVEIKDGPDELTNPVLPLGTRHTNKSGSQLQHLLQPPESPAKRPTPPAPLDPGGLLTAAEDGAPAKGRDGSRIVEFPATTTDASGVQDAIATNRAVDGAGDNATTRGQAVSHETEERNCRAFRISFP